MLMGSELVAWDVRAVDSLNFSLGKELSLDYIWGPPFFFSHLLSICALLLQDRYPSTLPGYKRVTYCLRPTCSWWKSRNLKQKKKVTLLPFLLACVERGVHPSVMVSRTGKVHLTLSILYFFQSLTEKQSHAVNLSSHWWSNRRIHLVPDSRLYLPIDSWRWMGTIQLFIEGDLPSMHCLGRVHGEVDKTTGLKPPFPVSKEITIYVMWRTKYTCACMRAV